MRNYKKIRANVQTSSSVLAVATVRGATRAAHAMEVQLSTRGFTCSHHSRGVFQFG
jgi:hypothetical protein